MRAHIACLSQGISKRKTQQTTDSIHESILASPLWTRCTANVSGVSGGFFPLELQGFKTFLRPMPFLRLSPYRETLLAIAGAGVNFFTKCISSVTARF